MGLYCLQIPKTKKGLTSIFCKRNIVYDPTLKEKTILKSG